MSVNSLSNDYNFELFQPFDLKETHLGKTIQKLTTEGNKLLNEADTIRKVALGVLVIAMVEFCFVSFFSSAWVPLIGAPIFITSIVLAIISANKRSEGEARFKEAHLLKHYIGLNYNHNKPQR